MLEGIKTYKLAFTYELEGLLKEQSINGKTHLGFMKSIEAMMGRDEWLIEFIEAREG